MGATKRTDIDKEDADIAFICKALGHPVRIQIMTLLLIKNNRTCGELVAILPLAQSTVSKHLLELKKASILKVKNVGKRTIYCVDLIKIELLKNYLNNYISTVSTFDTVDFSTHSFVPINDAQYSSKLYLKKYNYQFPEKLNSVD